MHSTYFQEFFKHSANSSPLTAAYTGKAPLLLPLTPKTPPPKKEGQGGEGRRPLEEVNKRAAVGGKRSLEKGGGRLFLVFCVKRSVGGADS